MLSPSRWAGAVVLSFLIVVRNGRLKPGSDTETPAHVKNPNCVMAIELARPTHKHAHRDVPLCAALRTQPTSGGVAITC